jgi:hypothetical protein
MNCAVFIRHLAARFCDSGLGPDRQNPELMHLVRLPLIASPTAGGRPEGRPMRAPRRPYSH